MVFVGGNGLSTSQTVIIIFVPSVALVVLIHLHLHLFKSEEAANEERRSKWKFGLRVCIQKVS